MEMARNILILFLLTEFKSGGEFDSAPTSDDPGILGNSFNLSSAQFAYLQNEHSLSKIMLFSFLHGHL